MVKEDKYEDFTSELYKGISKQFTSVSNDPKYHSELPSEIEYIKVETNTFDYGHPINWVLYGKTGIHGFIIGIITGENQVYDDMSENNYYPPIITQTLSSISPEYSYSQLAIVLVKEEISPEVDTWLKNWRDDNRYFRKVLLDLSDEMDIKNIAEKVVNNCFNPWYSIKLTRNDNGIANLFEEDEN
ncbi:hypothetical protein [Virgibacillus sp. JSM 102003]|uniref:hypothetical protein n=1 Tax=Virgibacillus sp. JSM 102003 TaxID=1562108 RepID=UPI0035C0ECE6